MSYNVLRLPCVALRAMHSGANEVSDGGNCLCYMPFPSCRLPPHSLRFLSWADCSFVDLVLISCRSSAFSGFGRA